MLICGLISKGRDKILIFEVGYGASTAAMLLVDMFWLNDKDLAIIFLFTTFPLQALCQFLILMVEKPKKLD